jgi:hypothetical protein
MVLHMIGDLIVLLKWKNRDYFGKVHFYSSTLLTYILRFLNIIYFNFTIIFIGKATGKVKKDTKQDAAKALLVSMDRDVEKLLVPTKSVPSDDTEKTIECDPDVEGNPVGDLNDLCAKLRRLPPEYEVIETRNS